MLAQAILSFFRWLFQHDGITHIVSIELFVVTATVLLVVRFLIDFHGHLYSNAFMIGTAITIDAVSYTMVQYTLGLMQLSGTRVSEYFQVWAVLLVTLQYSVKVGRRYGRSQQIPLLDMMNSLWTANILRLQTRPALKIPLWMIWCLNAGRIITYFNSSSKASVRNEENAKLVSEYMRYERTLKDAAPDNMTMSGCKYLVLGEELQEMKAEPPEFRLELNMEHEKLLTVEKIWRHGDDKSGLLGREADPNGRLKDVCLSFALYKLLRRTLYDLPIHEAGLEKTRRLVLEGILGQGGDGHERVFRITEVELLFLQDLFYSKHTAIFNKGFPVKKLVLSLSLMACCVYLACPVGNIPEAHGGENHNIVTHGVLVSRGIIALLVGKEACEIFMYVFSQWTKVMMICWYVREPLARWQRPVVEWVMRVMFRLISRGKWNEEIGQYNILVGHWWKNRWVWGELNMNVLFPQRIKLPPQAKETIVELLRDLLKEEEDGRRLKGFCYNYLSKAFGVALEQELSWAVELEADTHRILLWHIATCHCQIQLSNTYPKAKLPLKLTEMKRAAARPPPPSTVLPSTALWEHYMTAVSLSNYCTYLLSRRLVPDNGRVVWLVLFQVVLEIRLGHDGDDSKEKDSMLEMGRKLGDQLLCIYGNDDNELWRVLGRFWAGFLLHLAASTKAAKHRTHLTGQSELITHLWALLCNAGFVGGTTHGEQQLDPLDNMDDPANYQIAG